MSRHRRSSSPLSVQLYGTVSPALLGEAEVLLAQVDAPPSEPGPRLDAAAFARRAEAELDHYRARRPRSSTVGVEIRDDSSGVMVVNGNVLIAPTATVPAARVDALLQHEIGTHVVTHVNGSHQPLRLLGAGLAGYDETQEGLAVFAEYLVGGLTRATAASARRTRRRRPPDDRRGCVPRGARTTSSRAGWRRVEAFTITIRVFRSGGLTKDAVYLRGLRDVHRLSSAPVAVSTCCGSARCRSPTSPTSRILRDRGVLEPPLLVPRYLAEPDAQERLAGITTSPRRST